QAGIQNTVPRTLYNHAARSFRGHRGHDGNSLQFRSARDTATGWRSAAPGRAGHLLPGRHAPHATALRRNEGALREAAWRSEVGVRPHAGERGLDHLVWT